MSNLYLNNIQGLFRLDPGCIVLGVYRERDIVAYHRGIIVGFPKLYSLISGFSQISTQDSSKYKKYNYGKS